MKNSTIVTVVVIALILCVAVWYGEKFTPTPASVSATGCYVATLSSDVYVLQIQSEQNGIFTGRLAYNNSQKDSSSGTLTGTYIDGILLGTYTFDSEGMTSKRQVIFKKVGDNFVEGFGPVTVVGSEEKLQDPKTVVYDAKSTFIPTTNCTQTFTDSNKTFSFEHNAFFVAQEGDTTSTVDWRINSNQTVGRLLVRAVVPRGYLPKTNFSNALFTVGRSTDLQVIRNCTAVTSNSNEAKVSSVNLAGYQFTKFKSTDAGAGNFYDTTSYRGIVGGDCYAIEYTIHSTNIGNYSPDQGITQFDANAIQSEMEKMVSSFVFLASSN